MQDTSGCVGLLHAFAKMDCPQCIDEAEAAVHAGQHNRLQQADCNALQAGALLPHCT